MSLAKYLAKRSIILFGTLFATVLITIVLVGAGMDNIVRQSIIRECTNEANTMTFPTVTDRDKWIENCIETRMKG